MGDTKGITLIVLIITIIVLLILAAIAITQLTENGLFEKAKLAKENTKKATLREELELILTEIKIDKYKDETNNQIEEIIKKIEDNGYSCKSEKEEEMILQKQGYEFIVKGLTVIEVTNINSKVPDILENATFNYDKTPEIEFINITINYPDYANIKEYKIGDKGEWKTYKNNIILVENNKIYARYVTKDERNSEEVSEQISNINSNILKYTNSTNYLRGSNNTEKIERVHKLFDKNNSSNLQGVFNATSVIWFERYCSEVVYFQDNKTEPITATKVKISSEASIRGEEPIKGFYITASNTVDFSEEVELYRGEHNLNSTGDVKISEHQFTPKGNYQFYRLYVTSWWQFNGADGQNISRMLY